MKQLFLTSSVNIVAKDIATRMDTVGKKLVFIDTAAEIEEGDMGWLYNDRQSLVDIGFEVTDYTISNKTPDELTKDLGGYDVIYVSGGNSFYLLQQAQLSGFIEVVRDMIVNKEKIYIGTSAGSTVAGPDIYPVHIFDEAEAAPLIEGYVGFNLVNFCIFPHWGSEHFREKYLYQRLEHAYKNDQVPLVVLTDSQYVYVQDNKMEIIKL